MVPLVGLGDGWDLINRKELGFRPVSTRQTVGEQAEYKDQPPVGPYILLTEAARAWSPFDMAAVGQPPESLH